MSARGPGALRRALFRLTLLGYPAAFRREYREQLLDTFEEAWQAEVRGHELRFWLHLLRDGVVNGTHERARRIMNGAPAPLMRNGMRRSRMMSWLSGIGHDLRYAWRGVRTQRGAVLGIVSTLALGIGAATAIFTVVDAVLLRPLPYEAPDELVEFQRNIPGTFILKEWKPEHAVALLSGLDGVASLAAHARADMVLTGSGDARQVIVRAAGATLFETLGRVPARGRVFTREEAETQAPVVVVSHDFAQSLGGADAVGRVIELDRARYEVIGVMPPEFRFPTVFAAEVFLPMDGQFHAGAVAHTRIELLGRLAPGTSTASVGERAAARLRDVLGGDADNVDWVAEAAGIAAHRANPNAKRALWLVSGAVAFMLVISLLNATSLLLTRVSARAREFAVRHSLGATAPRLLRLLVTESLVIALLGGAAAVLLATGGVRLLMMIAPSDLTVMSANRVAVDDRVLWFAFAVTVVTGFLLGVLPALAAARAARRRIGLSISVYSDGTRERHALRGGLVIGQVALAMTLLVGAGLLTASFVRIMRVDPGFDAERLLLVRIQPNDQLYPNEAAVRAYSLELHEKIAAVPGVQTVARSGGLPPSSSFHVGMELQTENDAEPRKDSPLLLPFAHIRPDFIPTLGARIVAGRNFTDAEGEGSNVVIIDNDMARFLWHGEPAVGKRFRAGADDPWLTVVGVVDEMMLGNPDGSLGEFALLRPAAHDLANAYFAIRTSVDPARVLPAVRAAIRDVDPSQPVWNLWTAERALADAVTEQRFFMLLMGVLATLSMMLAAIGLYGLLAFSVKRRARELGIRMALGARAAALVRMVIGQGMRLVLAGVVLGLAGGVAAARLIRSLLFEVEPGDPAALTTVAAVMIVVALAACAVPALRAARLHPMGVLRSE